VFLRAELKKIQLHPVGVEIVVVPWRMLAYIEPATNFLMLGPAFTGGLFFGKIPRYLGRS
jgi:hypothetical protein